MLLVSCLLEVSAIARTYFILLASVFDSQVHNDFFLRATQAHFEIELNDGRSRVQPVYSRPTDTWKFLGEDGIEKLANCVLRVNIDVGDVVLLQLQPAKSDLHDASRTGRFFGDCFIAGFAQSDDVFWVQFTVRQFSSARQNKGWRCRPGCLHERKTMQHCFAWWIDNRRHVYASDWVLAFHHQVPAFNQGGVFVVERGKAVK